EPNVQVIIVGGRRPSANLPEQRQAIRKLRSDWIARTDNPLMIFENYPITDRGFYLPAFVARTIGESINATKGVSRGEDIWLSFRRDFDTVDTGFNHFQVYFTARMYWGGPEQDVEAMLDEYCRLFYGPAGNKMRAFFDYCEDHWQEMDQDADKVDAALALFDGAVASVDPDSVYARRLALIDTFLDTLRSKAELLGQKRGPVPKLRTVWDAEDIVIDGKLDDEYWRKCPSSASGRLRELQTGRQPIFGTSIMAGWQRGNVYFAIRCDERPGENLNIATMKNEDTGIWYGDAVEILLDTDSHRYYQIVVNPAGALVDLDRGADKSGWFRWESQAEVATTVADDHWIIEIRIPVTDDENDPLNQVIGRKPLQSLPWHFNICRQRIRENGSEYSAFSPTATAGFHEVMKFAQFYSGRSHRFESDPTITDYLIAGRAASELVRKRKFGEAIDAWLALADGEGLTDFQRSDALEQAAGSARSLRDYDRAETIANQIPIEEVASTARMENLIAQREAPKLIARFTDENFQQWPFWQAGAGAFARGRAYHIAKMGIKAEADLQTAREFTSESRIRMSILRTLGNNRETVLLDDDGALEAYREIAGAKTNTGSAEYFYGVQGAARILTRKGRFDEALAQLELVDVDKLSGFWRHSMLLARGETLAAAGRGDDARAAYRAALADDTLAPALRAKAEAAIEALEGR
ncbi:MAG: sugar-binding protein, partial [Verrucomicrobiales bacterium]